MTSKDDFERLDAIEKALLNRWPETRIAPTLDRIAALAKKPSFLFPTTLKVPSKLKARAVFGMARSFLLG